MKKQILGWAVIFAVTLLLSACAAPEARLSETNTLSGPDATIAQTGNMEQALAYMDDTSLYTVPVGQTGNMEQALAYMDDSSLYTAPVTTEHVSDELKLANDGYADIVAMTLLDARELELDQREVDLEWRQDEVATLRARTEARERELEQKEVDLEWRQDDIAIARSQLNAREFQLAQLEERSRSSAAFAGFEALPTNAEPGRCYAQVIVPGEYLTVTDKVLIKPAGEQIEIVPARYETVSQKVLVTPATTQMKVIPAEYRYVTESVMIEPPKKRLVQVPAQYETVLEQVMVAPATTTWTKGTGPVQRIDEATGEILCLVETPAQYQTVSKSVLKTPATTREVEDPAVFETIQRREIVTPERTELIEVPAQYKTVLVTKMIEPAQEKRIAIPARYQTVSKQIKVADEQMSWQEVLCDTNMTQSKVSDIQRALTHHGFNPGPIDGIVGTRTMAAVKDFQKTKGLPVSPYLTADTLEALGLGL